MLSHCSRVNIKRRMRNTNIKSSKFIKIITKGLVVTLQPGQRQKKDEEHRHQIIKIHQNHHQRPCCHILKVNIKKRSGTQTSNHQIHQNHHKVLLSHCSRLKIKRRIRNANIKSSKSSPKVLLSHCSRVTSKEGWGTQTFKSSKFITKGLVVTLQPVNIKKDQEHKHQIIKMHQNHHQRSCCQHCSQVNIKRRIRNTTSNHQNSSKSSPKVFVVTLQAGSTSKEG